MPTALTAQYELAQALAEDTASNILKCTDFALEASSLGTSYGLSWNYKAHPRQPSTLVIWTTRCETRYARTPPHAGSCNNYTMPTQCYYSTIMITCTEGSPSHCAKPIIITSSIWTPSTYGTQR